MATIDALFGELERFRAVLERQLPAMAFATPRIVKREAPFARWFREKVPDPSSSTKSGVYFIAAPDREILYIGKATRNNLAAQIWQKFGTPKLQEGDVPFFEESPFVRSDTDERLRRLMLRGEVLVAAAVVEPAAHASLVEVYLQTWCVANGGLPPLNRRIG
ncbi:MAG TPA: hypothetical protein ENJ38_02640 [Rhodospirillales bacterium]|nr:hypothetical protein [Rhodospirillales bacterium]